MNADEQEYWNEVNAEMRKPLPTDPHPYKGGCRGCRVEGECAWSLIWCAHTRSAYACTDGTC